MSKNDKIKFNVLAIICIIVFAFSITPKTLQNDTFYTISTGEYIVENGVDRTDHFSWSDLKYTYPHWAYDAFMYLVYDMRWNDRNIYINSCFKLYFRNHAICYKQQNK